MNSIEILRKEHVKLKTMISQLSSFSGDEKLDRLANLLNELGLLWDGHELREENLFQVSRGRGMPFPEETMLIAQHKELKGHWKVLQDAVASGDKKKVKIALDTDGKMLFDKFKSHIGFEEDYFDVLIEDGKF